MSSLSDKSPVIDLGTGLRKLLSSHHSVYNVLINPELDQPGPETASPGPSRLPELAASARSSGISPSPPPSSALELSATIGDRYSPIQPWQTLNLAPDTLQEFARLFRLNSPFSCPSPRPASASILSNSTDDEMPSESLVMVPSVSKLKVLVFETDEEDNDLVDEDNGDELRLVPSASAAVPEFDDDDETLTSNNHAKSMPPFLNSQNTYQLFVMPKMSLSQDCIKFQLTILSSNNQLMIQECHSLITMIEDAVQSPNSSARLHVSHLALSQAPLKVELGLMHNSHSLFLVNDGLLVLSEAMTAVARSIPKGADVAKVSVINILTTNYFINLFEIINSVTPHQIWKTSTLKTEKLFSKIKSFIESEMASVKKTTKEQKRKKAKKGKKKPLSKLIPIEGVVESQTYQTLKNSLQDELAALLTLDHVDPLNLSSSLGHVRLIVNSISKSLAFGSSKDFTSLKRMVIVCGFSVGIGVGILLTANEIVKFVSEQYHKFKVLTFTLDAVPEKLVEISIYPSEFSSVLVTEKFKVATEYFMEGLDDVYDYYIKDSLVGDFVLSLGRVVNVLTSDMRSFSSLLVASVHGGYDKSSALVSSLFL